MLKKLFALLTLLFGLACCATTTSDRPRSSTVDLMNAPTSARSAEPFLFADATGDIYLSWVHSSGDTATLKFSQLKGSEWSEPVTIASGTNWFVNWADYPRIAKNGKNFLAHFLEKSGEETYAYDIKLAASSNDGANWKNTLTLNDDGKKAEHGFVSMLPYGNGFFVTWLDGRNTVAEGMDNHDHHGAMTLRAALLDSNGTRTDEWELDDRTCDCCQTGAAITSTGPVVVYRDRSSEEIRDISIVRFENGTWSKPATVHADNWKFAGCPVNGPSVAALGQDVAVAWFTASGDSTRVNVAFSKDGGINFGNPILINSLKTIGRVDIEMIGPQTAGVCWMEGGTIKLMEVSSDGTRGEPINVASTSAARSAGFPHLLKHADGVLVAWTDDSTKNIKVARHQLPLSQ